MFGNGTTNYNNTYGTNVIHIGPTNRSGTNRSGDTSNLSLYTAIVEKIDTKVTWIEDVYNKFKNSKGVYNKDINININNLCTILNIFGSISNFNIDKANNRGCGFNGYLGEILFYNTALTPTNTTNNKNTPTSQYDNTVKYLRNKWNI